MIIVCKNFMSLTFYVKKVVYILSEYLGDKDKAKDIIWIEANTSVVSRSLFSKCSQAVVEKVFSGEIMQVSSNGTKRRHWRNLVNTRTIRPADFNLLEYEDDVC